MLKNKQSILAPLFSTSLAISCAIICSLAAVNTYADDIDSAYTLQEIEGIEFPELTLPILEEPSFDSGAIGTIGSPSLNNSGNNTVVRTEPPAPTTSPSSSITNPSQPGGPVVVIDGSVFLQPNDPISVCARNYGGSQRLESALEACQGFEACIKNDRFNRVGCFTEIFNADAKKKATATWKAVCFDKCKKARRFPSERPENCFADCYR